MENTSTGKETAEDLFYKFMDAEDCPEITHTFRRLVKLLGIKAENPREFYSLLKGKLQSWRCKSLWELLDCRANQKEYGKGKICEDTQVLIIGAGPIGLRTAIEVALLGAQVVIVEKRESFIRNNVLHLWPFLLTDFRSLGAKKFYGKFCSGSIDHISIRRLQAVLLKSALIFGAKLYTGVTFEHVMEPNSLEDGWKCKVSPDTHPVSKFEFDVLIGADGKKNAIPGFQQIEMRGTLAIGITANFVNHGSEEEANVEEISGIAYQFNPTFFDDLLEKKGIKLENIVYYKDETHYFVMTAGKASLLKRGALKEDFGQPAKLLAPCNINQAKLLEYVTDVVTYATKGTLKNLELKILRNNQPDIAAFDFTSIKKAEHAARIIERKGSKLLVGLVGDSLLEPFWPTGSGCARGVLSALDAAWMIRSFAQDKPPLQILSERENIYRLLSGTSAENLHKDHAKYTINPSTRYLHITHKRIREVYHLYDTDDAVNADFSIGSPQTAVNTKASRRRRISTGAKFTSSKGRKRGQASSHLAAEYGASRMRSTSGSSVENLVSHKPLSSTQSVPLDGRVRAKTTLSSAGSDDEVFEKKTRRVRINPAASPSTARRGRSSTVGSSGDELKGKRKKSGRRRTASKEDLDDPKEGTRKKKGFFGFGKSKPKRKTAEDSDHHSDKDVKLTKVKHEDEEAKSRPNFVREDSWKRNPTGSFSRDDYKRRSARDIIREMEARSKGEVVNNGVTSNGRIVGKTLDSKIPQKEGEIKTENKKVEEGVKLKKEDEKKRHKEDEKKRKEEERKKKDEEKRKHEEEKKKKEENAKVKKKHEEDVKKREQANNLHNKRTAESKPQTTPTNKKSKKQKLLDEIAKISPSAKRAMPVLSKLSPELDKENEKVHEHSVTSVVREAAMLLMATPLLVDELMPKKGLDRNGSWLTRSSGRVRDVIYRYNTLNDMKPLISDRNGDVTPLKRPRDGVDGPEEKPRKLQSNDEGQDGNENYSAPNLNDTNDGKQTTPSQKKKCLQIKNPEKHLISSPSLERLKLKLQGYQDDTSHTDNDSSSPSGKPALDFNSPIWQKTPLVAMAETKDKSIEDEPLKISRAKQQDSADGKSTGETVSTREGEDVVKDVSSPIWQKTPIAVVKVNSTENKENNKEAVNVSTNNEKVTEKQLPLIKSSRRLSLTRSTELLMEEKLTNLLNNTTTQKAYESIKYMIGIFQQIQKHPNEEKYYRIFTGRVKFRKHVWAVKNAKLFLTESGWSEVGSFVIFPLSKQIERPLLLLNKYLSIVDEKRKEEQNSSGKGNHSNLRRTSSSDLAEKIMDLKEALISSRSNSYKTRKLSWEMSTKSTSLHRTVSMDEVNNLRTAEELESTSVQKDSKYTLNEFQKEEKENEPASNLRRSVSENALFASLQNRDELSPPFSPFTRRFSQRSVKEQETACDLVMENPMNLETASSNKKHGQRSISLSDEEEVADVHKYDTLSTEYSGRQAIQSPRELVLEEADHLSSVLGNMLNTLGSSTDSERESDLDEDANKESEIAKVTETIPEKHRDVELESLCETLDLLIQENSSDSSDSSPEIRVDNITDRRRYNLRQTEGQESAFKPPVHPTKRATQKLGKTKSLHSDENQKTQKSSMTSARLSRERVTKAKNVDTASLTSTKRAQERAKETRRNSSNMVPKTDTRTVRKSTTDRRESSVKTRAQRQRERNNSRLSETTNRKQVASNKRETSVGEKPPAVKRPASKAKSVNMDRPRTRPLAAKSKSVDYLENGIKCAGTQPKTRSGRSSSSEDDKKPPRTRNAERTRIQPTRQSSGKGSSRSLSASNFKRQERNSFTDADKRSKELESSKRQNSSEAIRGTQSSKTTSDAERSVEGDGNTIKSEATPVVEETTCNQVVPDHTKTDGYSDQVESRKVETVDGSGQQDAIWEFGDVNEKKHTLLVDRNKSGGILDEENEKIVQFPSQSQDCYLVQESEQLVHSEISSKENPTKLENVDLEPTNRKMTLLDIGKQQSKERSKARKEVVSLSLDKRKQQILEAAVSKSKSKPANKRRSILQIKSRNDGNLVKNKKEAFEEPDASHKTSNGPIDEPTKRRHFRFHGRRKKSFELSNEQLEVVPEGHEEELENSSATNGVVPSKQAQDARLDDGISAELKADVGEKSEKNVEKEESRFPIKISPFQLRFTKRRGSYDLEKRASTGSMDSPQQCINEYEC